MENILTHKQRLIYDYIHHYVEENQAPPSLRDIGKHFDLSVGTVQDQVEAIRRKGFLKKEESKARGLRLPVGHGQIPILGRVHAGTLHAAFEDVDGYVPAGKNMTAAQHFALRVRGDSMIEAGILEGDMVIVRFQAHADDGDIVVARAGDETTIKKLRRRGERTVLEPCNPQYSPIEGPFGLIGIVVELRRIYKK